MSKQDLSKNINFRQIHRTKKKVPSKINKVIYNKNSANKKKNYKDDIMVLKTGTVKEPE